MVKSNIISPTKANHLYWLGRYVERVYMTLHILRKCYDKMIDGKPEDYEHFWNKLDAQNTYKSVEDFKSGMLYDDANINSVLSSLNHALDNAILLREDITSETLSFIEMSIAHMKKCKMANVSNITELQNITDWMLAFWGSCEERVINNSERNMMMVGKYVEKMDMCLRFNYPFSTIDFVYSKLSYLGFGVKELIFDSVVEKNLEESMMMYKCATSEDNTEYSGDILKELNQLVKV